MQIVVWFVLESETHATLLAAFNQGALQVANELVRSSRRIRQLLSITQVVAWLVRESETHATLLEAVVQSVGHSGNEFVLFKVNTVKSAPAPGGPAGP